MERWKGKKKGRGKGKGDGRVRNSLRRGERALRRPVGPTDQVQSLSGPCPPRPFLFQPSEKNKERNALLSAAKLIVVPSTGSIRSQNLMFEYLPSACPDGMKQMVNQSITS